MEHLSYPRSAYQSEYHHHKWHLIPIQVLSDVTEFRREYLIVKNIKTGRKSLVKKWNVIDKENYDREKLTNYFKEE